MRHRFERQRHKVVKMLEQKLQMKNPTQSIKNDKHKYLQTQRKIAKTLKQPQKSVVPDDPHSQLLWQKFIFNYFSIK